jgi:hypothetical protein
MVSNPTAHSPGYKSDLVGVGLLWLGAAHGDITEFFPLNHFVLIEVCFALDWVELKFKG